MNTEKDRDDCDTEQKETHITRDKSHLLQDHGWAWFVCLGCFLANFILGGLGRSDGVFFVELTDKFQEGAQLTAWPGAICIFVLLIIGPIATHMSNYTSIRTTVMIGSFISAVGMVITGCVENLVFIFFSYGVVQGIGQGLAYTPSLIIVGMYFNHYRGLAVGIGTAGVGVGTFCFPPMVGWLFQKFGFQGAYLILGAVVINLCVVGALFRPFFVHHNIILCRTSDKDDEETMFSVIQNNTEVVQNEDLEVEIDNNVCILSETKCRQESQNIDTISPRTSQSCHTKSPNRNKSRSGSCLKAAFHIIFPIEQQMKDTPKQKLIEWPLLRKPSFLFFCLSTCLASAAFKAAFTFLPAMARAAGLSVTNAAFLLSVAGVCDMISRMLTGFLLDLKRIRPYRPLIYNTVIFAFTVVSFFVPFMKSFFEFSLLCGLYGFLTGMFVSQKPLILVDILGVEKLGSSLGLTIFFQGIGMLIGPPFSGILKDVFGRFEEVFYVGGAIMAVAGIFMVMSNIYRVRQGQHACQTESSASPLDQHGKLDS